MAAELTSELRMSEVPRTGPHPVRKSAARVWSNLWPKLGAVVLAVAIWQLIVWSGWRPQSALPGPWPVLERLAGDLRNLDFYAGIGMTLGVGLGDGEAEGVGVGLGETLGVGVGVPCSVNCAHGKGLTVAQRW